MNVQELDGLEDKLANLGIARPSSRCHPIALRVPPEWRPRHPGGAQRADAHRTHPRLFVRKLRHTNWLPGVPLRHVGVGTVIALGSRAHRVRQTFTH